MDMESKLFKMVIDMLANISMESLMDTANIFGLMVVCIKAILNTESGMGMEYGLIKIKLKYIQVVIEWIKKKDLEFING